MPVNNTTDMPDRPIYIPCDGYMNTGITCSGVEMTDDLYFDPDFYANSTSPQTLWERDNRPAGGSAHWLICDSSKPGSSLLPYNSLGLLV